MHKWKDKLNKSFILVLQGMRYTVIAPVIIKPAQTVLGIGLIAFLRMIVWEIDFKRQILEMIGTNKIWDLK
jgi:hypothetical protein